MTLTAEDTSIVVLAPRTALITASLILFIELALHLFTARILLWLRTTSAQRAALSLHARKIHALRIESNKLNSPATFAEYAKVQRALQKELKAQQVLQAELGIAPAPSSDLGGAGLSAAAAAAANPQAMMQQILTFALGYGIKMAVYIFCFLACFGQTIFIVPTQGWTKALSYTPMRLVLGEIGIIPWLAVCSFVARAIKPWLS